MKSKYESRKIFQHFVLTCFNVDFGGQLGKPNKSWLNHRFELFDNFCYPSVRGQSNQNFKWFVLFDINTPNVFKEKIKKCYKCENIIPIYIRPCKKHSDTDKIMQSEIIPQYLTDEIEYLITTRVDNDDAICKDYIDMIQKRFNKQKFQFLNFTNGYIWNYKTNEIYLDQQPSNPFISLIEMVGEIKTVWSGSHPDLYKVGPIMEIETKPSWLQVSHRRSSNRPRGILQPPQTILQIINDFEIRKKLLSSYLIGVCFYFYKQILNRTRNIRGHIGLTGSKLRILKGKLNK